MPLLCVRQRPRVTVTRPTVATTSQQTHCSEKRSHRRRRAQLDLCLIKRTLCPETHGALSSVLPGARGLHAVAQDRLMPSTHRAWSPTWIEFCCYNSVSECTLEHLKCPLATITTYYSHERRFRPVPRGDAPMMLPHGGQPCNVVKSNETPLWGKSKPLTRQPLTPDKKTHHPLFGCELGVGLPPGNL